MGGYAGIATAIAMAVEPQKEMTPYAYGLVAVSNVYSHNTLPQIAELLDQNIRDVRHDLVNRIQQYVNHVQKSSHCVLETHNKNLDDIGQVTLAGKDEVPNPELKWLSFQPKFLFLQQCQDRSGFVVMTGIANLCFHTVNIIGSP